MRGASDASTCYPRRPRAAVVAAAFLARAAAIYASYRLRAVMGVVSLASTLLGCLLVGRLVSAAGSGFHERFGLSYEAFAVVGVFVHGAASSGLRAFRASVRREQLRGTFEQLLACPLHPALLVTTSALGGVLCSVVGGLVALEGVSRFVGLSGVVSLDVALPVLLYALSMSGLGLIAAAIVLIHKEGEPVSWALSMLTGILGGVVFPVELLPAWLRSAGALLPTTHALALVRSVLSPGSPYPGASFLSLALMAVGLPVAGAVSLCAAFRRARRDGSIGHY